MNPENLFEQDWRDCLRAHYVHVIRENDLNNKESLTTVLIQTGFSEEELTMLYIETTGYYPEETQAPVVEIQEETPPIMATAIDGFTESHMTIAEENVPETEVNSESTGQSESSESSEPFTLARQEKPKPKPRKPSQMSLF